MVGTGSETCLEEGAQEDGGLGLVPTRLYLLGLPEEPPGAAVVDVYFAQALKWSSYSNV